VLLAIEPDLFVINTIILPKAKVLAVMSDTKISTNVEIDIDVKTNTNAKIDTYAKIDTNAKISIDKPDFDPPHTHGKISIDITLVRIKV